MMLRNIPSGIYWKAASRCINIILKRPIHSNFSRILFSPSVSDKDLPTPTQFTSVDKLYAHDTDVLLEQLRKARSISRILELVSMHIEVMNDRHISTSFNLIHDKLKEIKDANGSHPDTSLEMISNEAFQKLCNRAMSRSRFFEPEEIVAIFKTLSALNVQSNTYVMQAMLKMLCHHINDLNLKELIFVNFLLLKQHPNALTNSLRLALPLVLQVQIDQQLDSENLNEVIGSLKMACKARLKKSTIEKVVTVLQSKVSSFSSEQAVTVVFSLFSMDTPVDGYMQLIKSAFDIICDDIDSINRKTLLGVTRSCRRYGFYYRSFFMKVAKKAVAESWNLPECYDLIGYLHRLDFFSPELLDLLCERICCFPQVMKDDNRFSILTVSELFTFADYQVCNVHNAISVLQSAKEKIEHYYRNHPHLYFKLVTCWTMLGCIDEQHLKNILNENFLHSTWAVSRKQGRSSDFEQYVFALQWSLENADRSDLRVHPSFIKAIMQPKEESKTKVPEYPLTKFLENGLGGPQFFHSGVSTHNGHFIDHVLAMRNGNYPVALNELPKHFLGGQPVSYIEALQLPDDARIVPIIVADKDQYCTDPCILKGLPAVKLRNLLKLSYSPIIINYAQWENLPDKEKIPYLMREVKLALHTETSKIDIPVQ